MAEQRKGSPDRDREEGGGRLHSLISHLDEIVFEFAPDGTYLNIWTGDESLLRRPREELLGKTVEEVLGRGFWDCLRVVFRRVLQTGNPETFEYPMDVLGGKRWFLARIAAIPGRAGEPGTLAFLARDITEHKRMEEELRASEQRFHRILEEIQLAALVVDASGRTVFCNDFLLRLLGRPREEVVGSDWFGLLPAEDRERIRHFWCEALRSPRTADYIEYPVLGPGRDKRLLAWNTIIERDVDGRPLFSASIGEDITERRQAEQILRQSDRMKSEFISTAAHELRTPLTTILGYAELLLNPEQFNGFTPEQQKDFLQEIHAKAEVLTGIVNELLDLSRIEAGRPIPLVLAPCDLDDILARTVGRYRARFPGRRFVLNQQSCPPDILIDHGKIEQVLENLLSNAVKYSPKGTVITITGRRERICYRVAVTDEGIGMAPEQVTHIFDTFYRADTSDTARPGLGLGMSIVRGIIEAHGGEIAIDSAPGQGTTIAFTLPVGRSAEMRGVTSDE